MKGMPNAFVLLSVAETGSFLHCLQGTVLHTPGCRCLDLLDLWEALKRPEELMCSRVNQGKTTGTWVLCHESAMSKVLVFN